MQRLDAVKDTTNLKAPGAFGGLGYRGFEVRQDGEPSAGTYVHGLLIDRGSRSPTLVAENRDLESWLLSTAGDTVRSDIRDHVERAIGLPFDLNVLRVPIRVLGACPTCHAADAPVYNPAIWNTPSAQPRNNCYNYANDQMTNTFAQPGRASGQQATTMSCAAVEPAAQADGLMPAANFSNALAAGNGWYVALVIWPNNDYHWYRQDKAGCWSHKPGQTPARNVDNSGKAISDPKTCDRGPYSAFCTYMVTKRTVHIR